MTVAGNGGTGKLRAFDLLGVGVSAVDYDSAAAQIIEAAERHRHYAAAALAVHGVMTGVQDCEHRYRLRSIDMVCPDGQPVRWALNLLYRCGLTDRVYGPRLMLRLCEIAAQRGLSIFLFGSTPEVIGALIGNLRSCFPRLEIAGAVPSRFRRATAEEAEQDAALIRASGARIVFIGLGCPRQEIWAYEMRPRIAAPLVAVGAAFPFLAGHLPAAPAWMQRCGLEWLFRLAIEPRRLWRRYLILNPLYVTYVGRQLLHGGSTSFLAPPRKPRDELRFG